MGFWRYAARVAMACRADFGEHFAAYCGGSAINVASWVCRKDVAALIGPYWAGWVALAVLCVSVLIIVFRSNYRMYSDLECRVGEGVVVRIVKVETLQFEIRPSTPSARRSVQPDSHGFRWQLLVNLEVVNNTNRLVALAFSAHGIDAHGPFGPGSDGCHAQRNEMNAKQRNDFWAAVDGPQTSGQTAPPTFVRVDITDYATSPPKSLTLTPKRMEGRLV